MRSLSLSFGPTLAGPTSACWQTGRRGWRGWRGRYGLRNRSSSSQRSSRTKVNWQSGGTDFQLAFFTLIVNTNYMITYVKPLLFRQKRSLQNFGFRKEIDQKPLRWRFPSCFYLNVMELLSLSSAVRIWDSNSRKAKVTRMWVKL